MRKPFIPVIALFLMLALSFVVFPCHAHAQSGRFDPDSSYSELDRFTDRVARALAEGGGRERERVANDVAGTVNRSITNIDSLERFTTLDPWLLGLAGNIDREHQQAREFADVYYRSRAEWIVKQGRGTSQDSAFLTYYILQEAHNRAQEIVEKEGDSHNVRAELERADIRLLSNAEHQTRTEEAYHFVVWTDYEEGQVRDANDPETWGKNAVVVDGRTGKSFDSEEASDEKYYSGKEEEKVRDSTAVFDEERAADPQWQERRRGSIFAEDCLIASAFYGYPRAAELAMLRQFRDDVLLNSPVGRQVVDLYYKCSPSLVSLIAAHDLLRGAARVFFVEPLVNVVAWITG